MRLDLVNSLSNDGTFMTQWMVSIKQKRKKTNQKERRVKDYMVYAMEKQKQKQINSSLLLEKFFWFDFGFSNYVIYFRSIRCVAFVY